MECGEYELEIIIMKRLFQDYFNFSRRELNGIIGLIILIILIYIFPFLYKRFSPVEKLTAAEEAGISALTFTIDSTKKLDFGRSFDSKETKLSAAAMFAFDPNTISATEWEQLGLTPKQAQSIINYRMKGGRFFRTEDLQKMYTISPERYEQLKPYVHIADNVQPKRDGFYKDKVEKKPSRVVVDVNRSDTTDLMEVDGIGPAFARRIISYRERIGGFFSKDQLKEVYGVDSIKFAEISEQIFVDPTLIRKIKINKVEFDDLKTCPYLRYKQMNAIIQYRKQHGNFTDVQSLKKVTLLTTEIINKLSPYLEF